MNTNNLTNNDQFAHSDRLPSARYSVRFDNESGEFHLRFDAIKIGIHASMEECETHAKEYDKLRTISFEHPFKYTQEEQCA